MPLVVGIQERSKGTIDALFSPKLWTKDGLLTQAGSETFWDRSTLYALRGVFAAGEKEKAVSYLSYYAHQRLLGDHVPYAIEAWPEGSQRHLSAESGLFCRIMTEGIFDIHPTGLRTFTMTPHLPLSWPAMSLNKIHAFNSDFDISIKREKDKIHVAHTPETVNIFCFPRQQSGRICRKRQAADNAFHSGWLRKASQCSSCAVMSAKAREHIIPIITIPAKENRPGSYV
jgi:hypothetical protein